MIIIETESQLKSFKSDFNLHTSIVFPMWVDHRLHPKRCDLSFLFIQCNGVNYILSLNHVDCVNQKFEYVKNIIEESSQQKIVFNLKSLLFNFKIKNGIDADSLIFLSRTEFTGSYKFDWKDQFTPIFSFYTSLGYDKNIIKSISILKLSDIIEKIITKLNSNCEITDDIKWYSSTYIPTLSKIESQGLFVERLNFIQNIGKHIHLSTDNKVYTEYNPYTATGRPSNRHGGVNYSALNKNSGIRESFISGTENYLVQFDYDSYHLRIIGNLIEFELPQSSIHQWLADQYGSTYEESKSISFRQIYGGIETQFLNIPFFKKTQDFINRLWETVNETGYIQTINRKIPLKWVNNPDPNKVFNYLIQALETEINVEKIKKIVDLINNSNIQLILYTYDSFTFRISNNIHIEKLNEIINILEDGGYSVKRKIGYTFGEL